MYLFSYSLIQREGGLNIPHSAFPHNDKLLFDFSNN